MDVFLLVAAPFAILLFCKVLYDALIRGRERRSFSADELFDIDYVRWCQSLLAVDGQLEKLGRPLDTGEMCYASSSSVSLYLPDQPTGEESEGVFFDSDRGVRVGCGWSILDMFPTLRFQGRGMLYATERGLRYAAADGERLIPLGEIHTVAASCAGLLVGTRELDRPMVFQGVNGQQFRDTLHILMEAD